MVDGSLVHWIARFLVLLMTCSAGSAIASELDRSAAVDTVFASMRGSDRPGAAVGIYRGGKLIYSQGYGMANLDAGTPITANTVFNLASVSKQFTAFSIALLAREGKVDLQADIRTYLPNLPDLGQRITVSDLVHHLSGIRDYIALAALSGHDGDSLLRQRHAIAILERQRGLNFQPGTRYEYSNSGYALLAEIVQAVSGQSLDAFMKERIFLPLGMRDTRVRDDLSRIEPGYAAGYNKGGDDRPWARAVYNRVAVGPGNMLSTVGDLAKWAGNFARPVVGDARLIEQISAPTALRDGTPINYGFGLTRKNILGHRVVTHGGGISGFRTTFVVFPDHDFAIVVLANHTAVSLGGVVEQLAGIYLQPAAAGQPKPPAAITPKAAVLASLKGSYLGAEGSMLTLRHEGKQLILASLGGDIGTARFLADGTFTAGDDDSTRYRPVKQKNTVIGLDAISTDADAEWTVRLERVNPVSPSAATFAPLAGVYYAEEIDTSYAVSVDAGKLTLRSLYLDEPQALQPSVADRFEAVDGALEGLDVAVIRGANGQPVGLQFRFGLNSVHLTKRASTDS